MVALLVFIMAILAITFSKIRLDMYLFFENRATKTCQFLALISNLMPRLTGKVKSHLK